MQEACSGQHRVGWTRQRALWTPADVSQRGRLKGLCRSSSQSQLPACPPQLKAKTCETRTGTTAGPWRITACMGKTLLMLPPEHAMLAGILGYS